MTLIIKDNIIFEGEKDLLKYEKIVNNIKSCLNCRWVGCSNYGKDKSTCIKYVK